MVSPQKNFFLSPFWRTGTWSGSLNEFIKNRYYEKAFQKANSLKPEATGAELDKIARGLMGQAEVPNVADATQLMYPGAPRT